MKNQLIPFVFVSSLSRRFYILSLSKLELPSTFYCRSGKTNFWLGILTNSADWKLWECHVKGSGYLILYFTTSKFNFIDFKRVVPVSLYLNTMVTSSRSKVVNLITIFNSVTLHLITVCSLTENMRRGDLVFHSNPIIIELTWPCESSEGRTD